jgi:hypothetical protein
MSSLNREKLHRKRLIGQREQQAGREVARFYQRVPERDPPPRLNLRDSRGRRISLPKVSILEKKGPQP